MQILVSKSTPWDSACATSSQVKPEWLVHESVTEPSLPSWASTCKWPIPCQHHWGTWDRSKTCPWVVGFGWGQNFSVWKEKQKCYRKKCQVNLLMDRQTYSEGQKWTVNYVKMFWKGKNNWKPTESFVDFRCFSSAWGLYRPHVPCHPHAL